MDGGFGGMTIDNNSISSGVAPDAGDSVEREAQQQVQLRIAEQNMQTAYANAFRTHGTAEEVIVDFGLNLLAPGGKETQPELHFQLNQRVILNHYSAKRLALALGQLLHRHEEQFGEIELDAGKRRQDKL
jgi:hypothetical protein